MSSSDISAILAKLNAIEVELKALREETKATRVVSEETRLAVEGVYCRQTQAPSDSRSEKTIDNKAQESATPTKAKAAAVRIDMPGWFAAECEAKNATVLNLVPVKDIEEEKKKYKSPKKARGEKEKNIFIFKAVWKGLTPAIKNSLKAINTDQRTLLAKNDSTDLKPAVAQIITDDPDDVEPAKMEHEGD